MSKINFQLHKNIFDDSEGEKRKLPNKENGDKRIKNIKKKSGNLAFGDEDTTTTIASFLEPNDLETISTEVNKGLKNQKKLSEMRLDTIKEIKKKIMDSIENLKSVTESESNKIETYEKFQKVCGLIIKDIESQLEKGGKVLKEIPEKTTIIRDIVNSWRSYVYMFKEYEYEFEYEYGKDSLINNQVWISLCKKLMSYFPYDKTICNDMLINYFEEHLNAEYNITFKNVKFFLEKGADANIKYNWGWNEEPTPGYGKESLLSNYYMSDYANGDIVTLLLENHADPKVDKVGTWLHMSDNNYLNNFKILLKYGLDTNATIKAMTQKTTLLMDALIEAVTQKHSIDIEPIEFIKLILEHGADPNYITEDDVKELFPETTTRHHSPLEYAVQNGKKDIAKLLIDYNATFY